MFSNDMQTSVSNELPGNEQMLNFNEEPSSVLQSNLLLNTTSDGAFQLFLLGPPPNEDLPSVSGNEIPETVTTVTVITQTTILAPAELVLPEVFPWSFKRTRKRRKTTKKIFQCQVCDKIYTRKFSLDTHSRIHTGVKPYECQICKKSFTRNNDLKIHSRVHTGNKPYQCKVCKKSFPQSNSLIKHMRSHTGDKPYKCQVCNKSFTQNGHLKTHTRIHTGVKPYKCQLCNRSFTENSNLTKHKRTHCGNKLFKFNESNNIFNSPVLHSGFQADNKIYKCKFCSKTFTRNVHLKIHNRTHKPYKCRFCNTFFHWNLTLEKHICMHTGRKLYKPDSTIKVSCKKEFHGKRYFLKQRRAHAKTYKCKRCCFLFFTRKYFVKHVQLHFAKSKMLLVRKKK